MANVNKKEEDSKETAYLKSRNIGFNFYVDKAFSKYLAQEDITEICVNRPNEIWVERNGDWVCEEVNLPLYECLHLANALASFKQDKIDETKPILSCVLLSGERGQVILPPACEKDTVSITIRKPESRRFSLNQYKEQGFFSQIGDDSDKTIKKNLLKELYVKKDWEEFLKKAILFEKNIVVAGETGSGKTTFMKTLVDLIPEDERLISIEDTPELDFVKHKNYVHLFYPSESKEGDIVTPQSLLKCCMRMKPSRILLAELRGGETLDFINVLSSGHGGSITSIHAGSVEGAFVILANLTKQNPIGSTIPYEVVDSLLKQVIDIIIQIDVKNKKRLITEVYFKDAV